MNFVASLDVGLGWVVTRDDCYLQLLVEMVHGCWQGILGECQNLQQGSLDGHLDPFEENRWQDVV